MTFRMVRRSFNTFLQLHILFSARVSRPPDFIFHSLYQFDAMLSLGSQLSLLSEIYKSKMERHQGGSGTVQISFGYIVDRGS